MYFRDLHIQTTKLHRFILRPLLWLFSFIFPARWLKIPDTVLVTKENISAVKYHATNENTSSNKSQSLVMFSHGLTGTGEENSIFCTALAKRGYVVASLHHRDGSSSRVPMSDGSCQYYKHFPTGEEYSPKHRLQQNQSTNLSSIIYIDVYTYIEIDIKSIIFYVIFIYYICWNRFKKYKTLPM